MILLPQKYERRDILRRQFSGALAGAVRQGKVQLFARGKDQLLPQPWRVWRRREQFLVKLRRLLRTTIEQMLLRLLPLGHVTAGSRRGFQVS